MKRVLIATALFAIAGCGGLDQTGHCDFQPTKNRCQERTGLPTTITAYEATCKALPNSSYAGGPCPAAAGIGGCDLSEAGNTVHDWYYTQAGASIATAADVMAACAGKPYLAP